MAGDMPMILSMLQLENVLALIEMGIIAPPAEIELLQTCYTSQSYVVEISA